ncbi:restriction endonuclease subunit S [Candidatus Woesearchaeota archaeon]|nr:restriction endonuclease subunit S [Nanoarchaeota archaeon]MCB9370093.1 restriction endonuclease subunit S [Candidatus Woesearchaeota archaeon]USN44624.1 MAG: restriction endonuclease subunit S [Candidatus Woesearchaeota archaeon]
MVWNKVKISTFLKERNNRFKPEDANKLGLKRIEKIDFSGNLYIVEKQTNTGMILVRSGDLVISGINVEKGALAVYGGQEDVLATIHYSSYEYDKNKIDIEYLKWFLKSNVFRSILLEEVGGGIKTELKPKRFLSLEVYLPDLQTQIEMRNKILAVEQEIGELQIRIKQEEDYLTKLKEAILQEAVQGKLVEQNSNDEPAQILLEKIRTEKEQLIKEKKFQKPKEKGIILENEFNLEIPKTWTLAKLVDLCFVTKLAGFEYTKYVNLKDVGEVPVIRAQNVKKRYIDKTNLKYIDLKTSELLHRCALTKESLLVTFIGAGIGDVALFNEDKRWHLAPNVAKLEPFNNFELKILPDYLLYYLLSETGNKEIFKSSKSTAQPSLSMGTIRNIIIPLPPLAEQQRIVRKVEELMAYCDVLEQEIRKSKQQAEQLMQSVLKEAFEQKKGL